VAVVGVAAAVELIAEGVLVETALEMETRCRVPRLKEKRSSGGVGGGGVGQRGNNRILQRASGLLLVWRIMARAAWDLNLPFIYTREYI